MKIQHQVPMIYKKMMPKKVLDFELIETSATCDSCAMTREKRGSRAKTTYREDLKCCTFEPFLPNYIVGALLAHQDRNPEAAYEIRERIANRKLALPLGVFPSVKYQVALNNRKPDDFGNQEDWLCSYFNPESQNCGIWRHRGSVCTGFYCKSDRKQMGLKFWGLLSEYMHILELSLAEELMVQKGFSPRQISENLEFFNVKASLGGGRDKEPFPSELFKKMWNGYQEEIEIFYIQCYELAKGYDRLMIEEVLGDVGEGLERQLLRQIEILETK